MAAEAALLLATLARADEVVRESRPAMGTIVGINVRTTDPARARASAERAYAAVEAWEALLSEWRPTSLVATLNAGRGPVPLRPAAVRLFTYAEALRVRSDGAFDLTWKGGDAFLDGESLTLRPEGTTLGLGGVLKGFLADRAAEALRDAGETDFLVDAAGDVVARGDAGAGERGWAVDVPAFGRVVHLRDAALSSSGQEQQPGHIVDPRTGRPATCSRATSVVAAEGMVADALSTAVFAACDADLATADGAWALRRDRLGFVHASEGARAVFERR